MGGGGVRNKIKSLFFAEINKGEEEEEEGGGREAEREREERERERERERGGGGGERRVTRLQRSGKSNREN